MKNQKKLKKRSYFIKKQKTEIINFIQIKVI